MRRFPHQVLPATLLLLYSRTPTGALIGRLSSRTFPDSVARPPLYQHFRNASYERTLCVGHLINRKHFRLKFQRLLPSTGGGMHADSTFLLALVRSPPLLSKTAVFENLQQHQRENEQGTTVTEYYFDRHRLLHHFWYARYE